MRSLVGAGFVVAVALAAFVVSAQRNTARSGESPPPSSARVYTANINGDSVSALNATTLTRVVADIGAGTAPQSISVSPDGTRVYTGNVGYGGATVTIIDAATNTAISTADAGTQSPISDIAVSPDGSKLYLALSQAGSVAVFDTTTLSTTTTFPLPSLASSSPNPQAIDVSADGSAVFVLTTSDSRVIKLSTANGATLDTVGVSGQARELRVSADGATLIVIGTNAAQFFTTAALDPVAGAFSTGIGPQADVAAAGTRFYVLNEALVPFTPPVEKGGPKVLLPNVGPSIDVYEAATGAYVQSFQLGAGQSVLGITVLSDASRAFVSRTGSANNGSVTAVNLTSGALGATGSTGSSPRRLAVKQAVVETPVVSYFLPRSVAVRLAGAGKDTLVASGFYDDGSLPVDYTKPVTVDIGLFSQAFTLAHKGANFTFKDSHIKFQITPNLKGSSQGKFKLKISKTTLMVLIDPTAPVEFHFRASGLPDAQGRVGLTAGKYRLGKKRGALFSPPAFPAKAKVKLGDGAVDSLTFKGGFATNGVTPAALGTVRFGLGPVFTRVIPGAQFKKTGDTYKFTAKQGKTSFTITLDFLRELVTVAAKGVELGTLSPATIDVVFDAGGSAGTVRTTVKVGVTGTTKRFY